MKTFRILCAAAIAASEGKTIAVLSKNPSDRDHAATMFRYMFHDIFEQKTLETAREPQSGGMVRFFGFHTHMKRVPGTLYDQVFVDGNITDPEQFFMIREPS